MDGSPMSVAVDPQGFVRLRWAPHLTISGALAREAVAAVGQAAGGQRLPLLVDMADTGSLSRDARGVFADESAASRIALLGRSSVDRVIANFVLGIRQPPVPTRFFTAESEAVVWLLKGADE